MVVSRVRTFIALLLSCAGCVPAVRAGPYYANPIYEPARSTTSKPAAYRVFPPPTGCAPIAPPVVFLPALGFTGESWSAVEAQLHACRARVLVDIPGIGESVETDRVPREEVVRAIEDIVRAESGGRAVVLAGHSIGGVLATWVALRVPAQVAGMVLVDAPLAPFPLSTSEKLATHPLALGPLIRLAGPHGAERLALRRAVMAGHSPAPSTIALTIEQTLDSHRRQAMRRYFDSFINPRSLAEELESLPRLKMPALVVWGEADKVVSSSLAEKAAQAWGGPVTTVLLPGIGHLPPLEVPAVVARLVDTFIASLPVEAAAPVDAIVRRQIEGVYRPGSLIYGARREWFPVVGAAALFTLDSRTNLDVVAGVARGSIDRRYPLETGRLVWTAGAGVSHDATPASDWRFAYLRTTLRLELVWKWVGGLSLDGTLLVDPSPNRTDRVGGFGSFGYVPSVLPYVRGFVGYGSFPQSHAQVLFGVELDARLTGWLF